MFKKFLAYVENQFQTTIMILRTDSDREYISHAFSEIFATKRYHVSVFMSL